MTVRTVQKFTPSTQVEATCPVHGTWTFLRGSASLAAFLDDHDDCQIVRRRDVPSKSRARPVVWCAS